MTFPFSVIDLTHDLSADAPTWDGGCGFLHSIELDYDDCKTEVAFRVQQVKMHAGIGTHIDAPAHCFPNGLSIHELQLKDLIAPCVRIDVSLQAHERYKVTIEDIEDFEKQHGSIPPKSFVLIHTGWGAFWSDAKKYRNHLVFPSLSEAAAAFLLKRDIVGLGIDTLSPDRPDSGFPVHKLILGAGKYIVENVANASLLPAVGSYSLALPVKTVGGTEAPVRHIALLIDSALNTSHTRNAIP